MSRKLKLKHFRSDQGGRKNSPPSPPIPRRFLTAVPPFCRRFPAGFFHGRAAVFWGRLFAAIWPSLI
jgi:hypothetical protein